MALEVPAASEWPPTATETTDMDVDMDLDLGPVDVISDTEIALPDTAHSNPDEDPADVNKNLPDQDLSPEKIHLRGVDDLTEQDLKRYSSEHLSFPHKYIEWVNDTSANLVFADSSTALDALASLTATSSDAPLSLPIAEIRPAKALSSNPTSNLLVRIALKSDKKPPRAYESSRFYLLNPQYDPREQRRARRNNGTSRAYRKRVYGDNEDRRRRENDAQDGFDASMYDDSPAAAGATPASSPNDGGRKIDSYRPNRNRSASPNDDQRSSSDRHRQRSPPPGRRHDREGYAIRSNRNKELLPGKTQTTLRQGSCAGRLSSSPARKELFPNKTPMSNHRRTDAMDAAEETADNYNASFSIPIADQASKKPNLVERISRPLFSDRIQDENTTDHPARQDGTDFGLKIRGASENGIAIKGGGSHIGTIRELFPGRGNDGKELFAEKITGRDRTRVRAEDLFS